MRESVREGVSGVEGRRTASHISGGLEGKGSGGKTLEMRQEGVSFRDKVLGGGGYFLSTVH